MRKIVKVNALPDYTLELEFDDGTAGTVSLSDLAGRGVFAIWLEGDTFEQVRISPSGELVWNDRVDLCPDALYFKVTGKKPEDVFPALHQESVHA
jgi:hypothetical protein